MFARISRSITMQKCMPCFWWSKIEHRLLREIGFTQTFALINLRKKTRCVWVSVWIWLLHSPAIQPMSKYCICLFMVWLSWLSNQRKSLKNIAGCFLFSCFWPNISWIFDVLRYRSALSWSSFDPFLYMKNWVNKLKIVKWMFVRLIARCFLHSLYHESFFRCILLAF